MKKNPTLEKRRKQISEKAKEYVKKEFEKLDLVIELKKALLLLILHQQQKFLNQVLDLFFEQLLLF